MNLFYEVTCLIWPLNTGFTVHMNIILWIAESERTEALKRLWLQGVFIFLYAFAFFVIGGIGIDVLNKEPGWDTTTWYQLYYGAFGAAVLVNMKHSVLSMHYVSNIHNTIKKIKNTKTQRQRKTQQNKTNCKNNIKVSETSILMLIRFFLLKHMKYLLISKMLSMTG